MAMDSLYESTFRRYESNAPLGRAHEELPGDPATEILIPSPPPWDDPLRDGVELPGGKLPPNAIAQGMESRHLGA
jgi:hypothetical protein